MSESIVIPQHLPLTLGWLDHYTLIVIDGQASCDFHTQFLGFKFLRIQDVGTTNPADRSFAMRNYILQVPGNNAQTCVITQGLSEESIFTLYMRKYGAGIHHVAYAVSDIESSVAALRAGGIGFTSSDILRDPVSGLRQIFIQRDHAGYFIELIERTAHAPAGAFTPTNMSRLVETMTSYVSLPRHGDASLAVELGRESTEVRAFLSDPEQLPRWTCHRSVRRIGHQCVEVRLHGDVVISTECHGDEVRFRFSRGEQQKVTRFVVTATAENACRVEVRLPQLQAEQSASLQQLLAAELRRLCATLTSVGAGDDPHREADERLILDHSLKVYQRQAL